MSFLRTSKDSRMHGWCLGLSIVCFAGNIDIDGVREWLFRPSYHRTPKDVRAHGRSLGISIVCFVIRSLLA